LIDCLIIIFFVCLLDGIYLRFNILLIGDEYTSIAVPASFAGIDWTSLTGSQSFHGYGFTIFLTPIYKFFKDLNIYQAYLAQNLLIRCVNGVLVYFIVGHFLKNNRINKITIAVLADICSFGFLGGVLLCGVEASMVTIVLAIVLLLLNSHGDLGKPSISIPIFFLSAYTITLHARAVIFISVILVIYLLWLVKNRSRYKGFIIYMCLFGLLLAIVGLTHKQILSFIFIPQEKHGGAVGNTMSSFVNENVFAKLSPDMLVHVIEVFFAIMCSYIFYSFGIICPVVLVSIKAVIREIKSKSPDYSRIYVYLYIFLSWLVVVAMYSGKGAYEVYVRNNYKPLSFIRYGIPYAYVIIIIGFLLLLTEKENGKNIVLSLLVGLVLCKIYILAIAPQFVGRSQITYFQYFILGKADKDFVSYFTLLFTLIVILSIIVLLFSKFNKFLPYCLLLLYFGFSMIARYDNYTFWNDKYSETYESINAASDKINNLDEAEKNDMDFYMLGDIGYCKSLQVLNAYIPFTYLRSADEINYIESDNPYIFTDTYIDSIDGWEISALDNNEYLLTLGSE